MHKSIQTCFVMMPSGNRKEYVDGQRESDFVFKSIITVAVTRVCGESVEIVREADSKMPGAIDQKIVRQIAHSDLAIVDITGQNANVFLELGIRYSLRKSITILLRQEDTVVPFDITHYRCVTYDPKWEAADAAVNSIAAAIEEAIESTPDSTDSLVFNVFPRLLVKLNEETRPEGIQQMPWDEYWGRFARIAAILQDKMTDGRYIPKAIVGLSNGGMMFADLLGRQVFHGTPILGLWVNRWDKENDWFHHPINEGVAEGLSKFIYGSHTPDLLIVDDIVASGGTITQAMRYLGERLPQAKIRFLPLFSANQKYFDIIRDVILWSHEEFRDLFVNETEIQDLHSTRFYELPYSKHIRSG